MSIKFVQITDHAYERWNQRVNHSSSEYRTETIYEIIEAVKKAKFIRKHEKLPCTMPKKAGIVYAMNNDILFVLESIDAKTYRLITVITDFTVTPLTPPPSKFNKKRQKYDEDHIESLVVDKANVRTLKVQISKTPKKYRKRKELLKSLFETEELNNEKDQIFYPKKSTEEGLKRFQEILNKSN